MAVIEAVAGKIHLHLKNQAITAPATIRLGEGAGPSDSAIAISIVVPGRFIELEIAVIDQRIVLIERNHAGPEGGPAKYTDLYDFGRRSEN